jgi:hypothetical protein
MNERIIEINGKLIAMRGNIPVRVLSDQEEKEVRYKATAQYKAKTSNNIGLLDRYLTSLYRGNIDDVVVYRTEILRRMSTGKQ